MRIDPSEPAGEGLGPAGGRRPPEAGTDTDRSQLARGLLRIAAIPANEDVIDAALRLVVALARVTVAGADGVSVSLRRQGILATVAASDQTIRGMDSDQYSTGEGPCVAAATEGLWFHVESLDDELRWPAFIPRARDRGINSILSTPLLTQTRPVSAAVDVSVEDLSRRLQEALRGRDVIAQARGVLMERHRVSADAAYTTLRRSSRQSNTPLRRLAEDVTASTQRPPGAAASNDA